MGQRSAKSHDPWIVELMIGVYLFLRRHMWMTILTKWFGLPQRRAAKMTRAIARYCCAWWLGRLMNLTVYRDRACVRKLIYIGHRDPAIEDNDSFLELGKLYTSLTFDSATYTIEGCDGGAGYACFEIAD